MVKYFFIAIFGLALISCKLEAEPFKVSVKGTKIMVNNNAYLIKGICYHPVPKGSNNRNFDSIDQDLALMKEAGINTIRVYVPIDDSKVLDKINEAGLKVIIGFGYNQNGKFDILSGSFLKYIEKYKSHPAILFWEFGNEYNYHPEWFEGDMNNWYNALNDAAKKAKEIDPNHPVSTAHGELPSKEIVNQCFNVDIWGLNIYRWDSPGNLFEQWAAISNKPMFLSEAGADSYMTITKDNYLQGANEDAQANATQNILNEIFKATNICSGVTLFAFSDEWWKAGDNNTQDAGGWAPNSSGVPYDGTPNEEYWGIVDINRNKKKAFDIVKNHYTYNTNKTN